jgi:hypothetical protein
MQSISVRCGTVAARDWRPVTLAIAQMAWANEFSGAFGVSIRNESELPAAQQSLPERGAECSLLRCSLRSSSDVRWHESVGCLVVVA